MPARREHGANAIIHDYNTPNEGSQPVKYQMLSLSGNEALETLEAHVLARAYRALWRVLHGSEPTGPHVILSLDLLIDFGSPAARPLPAGQSSPTRRVH